MDLFAPDPRANLLPCDGIVNDLGPLLSADEAAHYERSLRDGVPWRHDETVIFGRRIVTARMVAWFADGGLSYRYSGTTKEGLAWTPELLELKTKVEASSGERFNSCLLNLYHHGGEGMGWHSDDEKSIVPDSAIASLSLGAARKFAFKHKRLDLGVSVTLESGGLLLMRGQTQRHWLHSLPKSKKITAPRINLTFRSMLIP